MRYILYADMEGISIETFINTYCRIKEIPIEMLRNGIKNVRNITHTHLSTAAMNKHLNTKFEVIDFTQCLDNGDVLFVIKPTEKQNGPDHRYYMIEILGEPNQIIRRPKSQEIDELIECCINNNANKALKGKNSLRPDNLNISKSEREWAVRDYFNRVDKAYRLYDSALTKDKPESLSNLAYHKRTLARDLDLAFKRACEAKLTVEEIRSAELSVIKERMRRNLHAI